MKCRRNVASLTPLEKSQLVQAFLDLKDPVKSPSKIPAAAVAVTASGGSPNRYDDYVWMHNTVGFGAHRGPAFGPWHREFLLQIEFDLQQVSGDAELTLPYWDWTTARTPSDAGWPFTNDFMGGFGNAGPGRPPGTSPPVHSAIRPPGGSTSAEVRTPTSSSSGLAASRTRTTSRSATTSCSPSAPASRPGPPGRRCTTWPPGTTQPA